MTVSLSYYLCTLDLNFIHYVLFKDEEKEEDIADDDQASSPPTKRRKTSQPNISKFVCICLVSHVGRWVPVWAHGPIPNSVPGQAIYSFHFPSPLKCNCAALRTS